jgi:nicotinate-nucleotide adenylyltransferase
VNNILIYGGTFDPPHLGHLNTAQAAQVKFHFERFVFLPCKTPLLKEAASASSAQRMEMLKLAIQDHPEFTIDSREITRSTPSYMVETLESFRQELGEKTAITLCLGMDAFLELPKWHDWERILALGNLLVLKRPKTNEQDLSETLKTLLSKHEVFDKRTVLNQSHGAIYRFDAGQYTISSTLLRKQIQAGQNIEAYLPPRVYQYIKSRALYLEYPCS